jgi:HlyD family secretion protein
MKNKWWIVAVVAVVIVVLGCFAYPRLAAQRAADDDPGETAVVRRGALVVAVDATGSLAPSAEASLSFSSSGRVDEVLVEEGELMEAGQPLVRLETDDLELQVAQAEATLAAAEAQLARLLAPPRDEEVAVYEANLAAMEAQVGAADATRDQLVAGADKGQIAAAEADVAAATTEQKSAFDTHERTMECFSFKLPAGTVLPDGTVLDSGIKRTICPSLGAPEEQARYALAVADASLATAQAQLDELLDGADADEVRAAQANVWTAAAQRDAAQAELDLLLAGAMEEQIETAQASVDDARAALEQAQLRLEKATLSAPMAGTVTFLDVQPGEIVNANQTVVVLSDLAALEVDVSLDETDVAQVVVGQEVLVRVDAFPGVVMAGQVTDIASVAQTAAGVVLYPVTIRLVSTGPSTTDGMSASEQDLPVRAGMTTDVEIATASQEGVLIVPLRAVHTEGERAYVDRLVGGQFERVEVALGMMTEIEIEITDGLAEGDVVGVVAGPAEGVQ